MIRVLMAIAMSFVLFSCGSEPVQAPAVPDKKKDEVKKDEKPAETPPSPLAAAIASENQEKLRQAATDALAENPKDVAALNALAVYYYRKGQTEAAAALLGKARSLNANSAEVYNNLGLVALAQGKNREAIQMFRKSTELNPAYYPAAANAAALYLKERDYVKTVLSLEKYAKDGTADADGLNNYAVALAATGKVSDAAEVYEALLKAHPDHRNALLNAATLMIDRQEKYKEGLDLLNRLKFVGSDNESREVIKDLENRAKAGLK